MDIYIRRVLFFAILLLVAGCGSGSGSGSGKGKEGLPPCLAPEGVDVYHPENYHYLENLCSQGEVASSRCVSEEGDVRTYGNLTFGDDDAPALNKICRYLQDPFEGLPPTCDLAAEVPDDRIESFAKSISSGGGLTEIVRWAEAPKIRLATDLSERRRRLVLEAVSRVNRILPDDYDLVVGDDVEPHSGAVPNGEIFVDFAEILEWKDFDGRPIYAPRSGGYGLSWVNNDYEITKAHIWIAPKVDESTCHSGAQGGRADRWMLGFFTHELLHVLAFVEGHAPNDIEEYTVMTPDIGCRTETVPGLYDCAVLRKFYELEPGTPFDEID